MRYPRLFVVLTAALLAGCTAFQSVSYNTKLQSVERSDHAKTQYGDYTLAQKEPGTDAQQVYEDDLLRAIWGFDNTSLRLTVENKSAYSLRVRLDKGTFVMPDGRRVRLLRGDMGYPERDGAVPPLIVPSGDPILGSSTSVSVHLLPRSTVEFARRSGTTSGYGTTEAILQPTDAGADSAAVSQNIGRRFSVTLPVENREAIDNYTFVFKVIGAKIPNSDGGPQVLGTYPTAED
ncbi:MAG: hypothetical protein ABEL04_09770 [Salinibacter sp.]|uniref:hypothetical protein n=1 Tax=Salinibacter sp. TaxID=2065818 RepID=UPI0035D51898